MRLSFVRSCWLALAGSSLVVLAACGGPADVGADRLDGVEVGTSRSALLDQLGTGPLTASGIDTLRLARGFRRQQFFRSGTMYEVIWFRTEPGSLNDAIVRERETPILLTGDTVLGWGWEFYAAKAREVGIPNPLRDQERLDSLRKVNPQIDSVAG